MASGGEVPDVLRQLCILEVDESRADEHLPRLIDARLAAAAARGCVPSHLAGHGGGPASCAPNQGGSQEAARPATEPAAGVVAPGKKGVERWGRSVCDSGH